MVTYDDISGLARQLSRDGLEQASRELANAHDGIFNGTELFMKWRFCVAKVLAQRDLSPLARAKAEALHQELDRALS